MDGATYRAVRDRTEALAAPLGPEDQVVQSMPDASPTKWHRAHTTWFFDEFVLGGTTRPDYRYLFNSYYEAVGPRQPRNARGLITRPTVDEVATYRAEVDDAMAAVLTDDPSPLVELGLHHEQQHQELLLMDAKHLLHQNPLRPAYSAAPHTPTPVDVLGWGWVEHPGGIVPIGHDGRGFTYDNELPRHDVLLQPFALADRAVTAGEWRSFMADGGYERSELWLSDGWYAVQQHGWDSPLYWEPSADRGAGEWDLFTLGGLRPVDPSEPVVHVSYYEADAYARWAGHRLPTEQEWEAIAHPLASEFADCEGTFVDDHLAEGTVVHPRPAGAHRHGGPPRQLFGDVWEWTGSAYLPYPGFAPAPGAVGEYNGKFMSGQHVLRGGCCATPAGHLRTTYRNFFPPSARWAFSGVRLATS